MHVRGKTNVNVIVLHAQFEIHTHAHNYQVKQKTKLLVDTALKGTVVYLIDDTDALVNVSSKEIAST